MWEMITTSFDSGYIQGAATNSSSGTYGLVTGHCYSILGYVELTNTNGNVVY